MNLLDIFGYLAIAVISTLPELQIHLVVLGYIFPTLLVAGLAHSYFVFILSKILSLKEKIRTS
jgi:hypothetical protein